MVHFFFFFVCVWTVFSTFKWALRLCLDVPQIAIMLDSGKFRNARSNQVEYCFINFYHYNLGILPIVVPDLHAALNIQISMNRLPFILTCQAVGALVYFQTHLRSLCFGYLILLVLTESVCFYQGNSWS